MQLEKILQYLNYIQDGFTTHKSIEAEFSHTNISRWLRKLTQYGLITYTLKSRQKFFNLTKKGHTLRNLF